MVRKKREIGGFEIEGFTFSSAFIDARFCNVKNESI